MMNPSEIIVERHIPCPACPSSDAYCMYADGHGYCFSCSYYKPKEKTEFVEDNNYTFEYLPWRGVSKETMAFYDVKTKVDPNGEPIALGFKYPNEAHKVRSLKDKEFYVQGEISKAGLFGRDKFGVGHSKYVTITEGELDALSLYEALGSKYPVVSVQSASSAHRNCADARDYLNSFERIYIAFDGDKPGREATRAVASLFDVNKVYDVQFTELGRKDANSYTEAGENDKLRALWWAAKRFLPEGIYSTFQEFEEIIRERPKQGAPYPFPTLNSMTYGIRTGESVLITAQEGVGKTELMHAIEYGLLTNPEIADANVGAIFLEEPKGRHLQALAGLELKMPVHLPDVGCSESEIVAALKRVVGRDERLHIYSHFGSDDPDVITDTIRFLVSGAKCRYILLDHISMVVSGLQGDDERKALDYLSTRLEMLVKELDFALIFVSHVNDNGLTRGSRYISKVADIRIDATRDISNSDPIVRNTTHLTISKNRFSGQTGPAGILLFDPKTYAYTEMFASNDNIDMREALPA